MIFNIINLKFHTQEILCECKHPHDRENNLLHHLHLSVVYSLKDSKALYNEYISSVDSLVINIVTIWDQCYYYKEIMLYCNEMVCSP